jgi:hypothetical protein
MAVRATLGQSIVEFGLIKRPAACEHGDGTKADDEFYDAVHCFFLDGAVGVNDTNFSLICETLLSGVAIVSRR